MDPNALGGMLFTLLMTIVIVGGILVFPVMRRLGSVLEMWLNDRRPGSLSPGDAKSLRDAVTALADRLEALEDHQKFIEDLFEGRQALSAPRSTPPAGTEPGDDG